ncbi:unnamed protein product [Clonostachys rosea f. rosea IK726]|uniref:Oxidoreductase n=2 Tax=Bionectria ochroleuca TaxID=29856 RepID=A0A0B7JVW5_BIOOC|nr:unnamed protein product [Clonostachys rosea f. rosea IK726]
MGYHINFELERDVPELTGKVLLITGGTGGLGAGAAALLAKRNPSKIYITGRNEEAARDVFKRIKDSGSQAQTKFIRCDHTSLDSVREAANIFLSQETRLDVLMANAGVMASPPGLTKDGYEYQFGINHVAHALLIQKLLPTLQKTAKSQGDARVILLTSLAFVLAPKSGGIVFDELRTTQAYWILGDFQRYAQSKLANLLYGRELARQYPEITTIIIHPGESATSLVNNLTWTQKAVVYGANYNKFLPEHQGYLNQVWAVGVPKAKVVSGELYEPVGVPTQSYTSYCLDKELASKLWTWTEKEIKPWL